MYLGTRALIAPFWAEAVAGDITKEDSVVYYDSYTLWNENDPSVDDSTRDLIASVSQTIKDETNDIYFKATYALVVTWWNLRPPPYQEDGKEVRH